MLKRRIHLLVLLLTVWGIACPRLAVALVDQTGPSTWIASLSRRDFESASLPDGNGKQRESNWCWAACVQMVLRYHGLDVNQEQVVKRIFGDLRDKPATPEMVLKALNASAFSTKGIPAKIAAMDYRFQDGMYIQDLGRDWPLIIGLKGGVPNATGHCYVLVAVKYTEARDGGLKPQTFYLMDPWPGNETRVEMTEPEFARRFGFAVRIHVSREHPTNIHKGTGD